MSDMKLEQGYKKAKWSFHKEIKIPIEWNVFFLDELILTSRNGFTGKPNDQGIGTSRLGISSITNNNSIYVDENIHRFIEIEKSRMGGFLVHKNDLLVCRQNGNSEFVGQTCVVDNTIDPMIFSDSLIRLQVKTDEIVPEYLALFLSSTEGKKEISKYCVTTAGNYNINGTNFKKIRIILPTFPEQQKIVSIFSNVAASLLKTDQIIIQTLQFKKGIMQKLFTKGIGHTNFKKVTWYYKKEITIPNEWNLRTLGDVCQVLDSSRVPLKKNDRKKIFGKIPYYGASGVIDYINDYIFDEKLLCLAEDGENLRSRVLPVSFTIEGKSWVNNHVHVLRPNIKLTEHEYLENYLNLISYIPHLDFTAQPKLNQKEMKKIKFICPPLLEQKLIATLLIHIDSQIQKLRLKKKNLELLNKGLMQKLLIGKIRVKF